MRGGGEWTNPWHELRQRSHIVFALCRLPGNVGAVYWPRGDRAAIIIDRRLTRRERRAALAHELVHDERGGGVDVAGMPCGWAVIATREEQRVDRLVAAKLVPLAELRMLLERMADLGPVEAWEIADYFDVPDYVAERALRSAGAA